MGAIALALFIFTMMQTILTAMEVKVYSGPGETRLGVIEKYGGPRNQLPYSYWRQLNRFKHVTASTPMGFAVISVGWTDVYYISILVDPETYREVFKTTANIIPKKQYDRFLKTKNGVLVGAEIMRKYSWKVGENIILKSLTHNVKMNMIICGVLQNEVDGNQQFETEMLINWSYYEGLINNPGKVNIYWLRLDRPASVLSVINDVSSFYQYGPMQVSVETESSMLSKLTAYTATIQLIIKVISNVILFTIFLITVNTIALSMRERTKEIALMKAIGFTPQNILWMIITESVFISLISGLAGILIAYLLFNMKGASLSLGLTFDFVVSFRTVEIGVLISFALGLLSGIVPAYYTSKVNVIKAFHSL
jgi:putative ABC transport system permease protein